MLAASSPAASGLCRNEYSQPAKKRFCKRCRQTDIGKEKKSTTTTQNRRARLQESRLSLSPLNKKKKNCPTTINTMKADGRRNRERANDANDGMHNTATGVTATVT